MSILNSLLLDRPRLLVALFGFSWWTAANDEMRWHRFSGYAILGGLCTLSLVTMVLLMARTMMPSVGGL